MSAPASILLAATLGLAACGGGQPARESQPAPERPRAVADDALVRGAWQVRLADDAARAPFEGHGGWSALFRRAHDEALAAFAADRGDGRGLARVHVDEAGVYRQAALLAARATLQVYGADRQEADPAEVDYLLVVSGVLAGDCDTARAARERLAKPSDETLGAREAWWAKAVDACPAVPDPLADGPFADVLPAPAPGTAPALPAPPDYRWAERTEEAREVEATDPTLLYLLSRWHQEAARAAAPEGEGAAVDALLAPWRLPGEPAPEAVPDALDDGWLFAGFYPTAADLAFVLAAGEGGTGAVEAWKDRSPLAAALAPAVKDGALSVETVLDQAVRFRDQVQADMVAVSGGEQGFHRPFADLAMLGLLRAGMVVADATGAARDAGVLRINALERSTGSAADPVFALSVAAWDTGNRNPLRAQDILHGARLRFPAVESARYPLDAMHVRLARNAAPATPVH